MDNDTSKPKIRKIHTYSSVYNELIELDSYVRKELDAQRKLTTKTRYIMPLIRIRNRVENITKHLPKAFRIKRRTNRKTKPEGLTKKMLISDELTDFLMVKRGTKLSRVEVRRAISIYCHINDNETRVNMLVWAGLNSTRRDLRDNKDKRIIHPDEQLSTLLEYTAYKEYIKAGSYKRRNKSTGESIVVTDDRLFTYIITKLLERHFHKD